MAVETRRMCRLKKTSCFFALPPDIIADILLRLPTKSIGKLRCVCKQWLSLTCDPHFLKSHHERSSMMIISTYVADGKFKLYNISIGDRKDFTERSYTLNNLERKNWRFSNFVDGLTCIYNNAYHDIYLLNPTTRELHKLPKKRDSHNKCCKRKRLLLKSVGLSYDMNAGQRKVVTVFRFSERDHDHLQCDVYSTGTKQWRCLGETPFVVTTCRSQALHRGAFHWIGYHRKTREMGVFRFGIKEEKFGSPISIPYAPAPIACFLLKESGGKLWLTFRKYFEGYFEIWSMKDMNETWVKEYKFNDWLSSLHIISSTTEFLDDEIILTSYAGPSKWHVVRYNPRSGVVHKIFDATTFVNVAIYRESLISPKKLLKLSPKT